MTSLIRKAGPFARKLALAGTTPLDPLSLSSSSKWSLPSGQTKPSRSAIGRNAAASFNGSTAALKYASVNSSTAPLSCMIEFVAGSTAAGTLMSLGDPLGTAGLQLFLDSTNGFIIQDQTGSASRFTPSGLGQLTAGKRYVLAFSLTASGATPTVYLSGAAVSGSGTVSPASNTTAGLQIGASGVGGAANLNARVGAFAVWQRALNASELKSITNEPRQLFSFVPKTIGRSSGSGAGAATINDYPLTSGASGSTATSFSTATITPTANRLQLLAIEIGLEAQSAPIGLTVTGNGLTWVEVGRVGVNSFGNGNYAGQLSVFRAMGASPTAGVITISAAVNCVSAAWSVVEFDGVDKSGTNGSSAIVQAATNTANSVSSLSVTLGTFSSTSNATYGVFGAGDAAGVKRTFTAGNGFSIVHSVGMLYSNAASEFSPSANTNVAATADASTNIGAIAIELRRETPVGINGTLNATLGAVTLSAAGSVASTVSNTASSTWASWNANWESLSDAGNNANIAYSVDANDGAAKFTDAASADTGTEFARLLSGSYTWEQIFGIPAGATVTQAQVTAWKKNLVSNVKLSSHSVKVRLLDGSNNAITSADLINVSLPTTTDGSYVAQSAGSAVNVNSTSQPSNSPVRLSLEYSVVTTSGAGSAGVDCRFDDLTVTITYTTGGSIPVTRTGSLVAALGAATTSATASVAIVANASKTLGAVTLSADATHDTSSGSGFLYDSSSYNSTQTANGGAVVSTTVTKFGVGSLDLTAVNNASSVSTPARAGFQFGSGQFTIEAWGYFASFSSSAFNTIAAQWAALVSDGDLGWTFRTDASGKLGFTYTDDGANEYFVGATWTPSLSTWYHLAVDRDAFNVIRVYVNGSVIASATDGRALWSSSRSLMVGNDNGGSRRFTGYLDELRITKGAARYGGSFTPPFTIFAGSTVGDSQYGKVSLLLHFDPSTSRTASLNRALDAVTVSATGTTLSSTTRTATLSATLEPMTITGSHGSVNPEFIPTDWLAWLKNEHATRVVLVEAQVTSGGVDVTRYLSNRPYATKPTDSPANQGYMPIIAGGVSLNEQMTLDGSGISLSYGDIEIYNTSGELDAWLDDIWKNRPVNVYVGDASWKRSDFRLVMAGVVEDIDSRARDRLNIKMRDKLQRLNTPVSDAKVGTGNNPDTLRPLAFGESHNVTPLLIDGALLQYQVHNGQIERIIEVRDNGVPVSFTPLLSTGSFLLLSPPDGQITLSVQGEVVSTYTNTVAPTIRRLVTAYGTVGNRFTDADINLANFTDFDNDNKQPIGLYLSDRANVLQCCQDLASSAGAQIGMSRSGRLRLLKIELPPTDTPFDITASDMVEKSLAVSARPQVVAAVKLGYCRNYTVQSNLLTSIPEEHKQLYALEWLTTTQTDSGTATTYKLFEDPQQQDTLLLRTVDAVAEANRRLLLFKTPRTVYHFDGFAQCLTLELGQAVRITHSRFGLSAGKVGVVVGLSPDWMRSRCGVDVLI